MLEKDDFEALATDPDSKFFVWTAPSTSAKNSRKTSELPSQSNQREGFRITRKHRLSASDVTKTNDTRLKLRNYLTSVHRTMKPATSSEKTSHQWSRPYYRRKKKDRKRHKQDIVRTRKQKCPSIELAQFKRDQNQEVLKLLDYAGLDKNSTEKLQNLLRQRVCGAEAAGLTTSTQLSRHIIQEIHNLSKDRASGFDFQFCYQLDRNITSFAMGQLGYSGILYNTPSGELQFVQSLIPDESLPVPILHSQKLSEANIQDVKSVSRPHLSETIKERLKTKLGRLTTDQGYKNAITEFPMTRVTLWRMWLNASAKFYESTSVVLLMEKNDERQKQVESDDSGLESEMLDMMILGDKCVEEPAKNTEVEHSPVLEEPAPQEPEITNEPVTTPLDESMAIVCEEEVNVEVSIEVERLSEVALLSPEAPLIEEPLPKVEVVDTQEDKDVTEVTLEESLEQSQKPEANPLNPEATILEGTTQESEVQQVLPVQEPLDQSVLVSEDAVNVSVPGVENSEAEVAEPTTLLTDVQVEEQQIQVEEEPEMLEMTTPVPEESIAMPEGIPQPESIENPPENSEQPTISVDPFKKEEFRVTFNTVIYYSNHDGTSGELPFPGPELIFHPELVPETVIEPVIEEEERTFVPFLEEAYAIEIGKPSGSKQHRLEMRSYTIPVRENRTVYSFEEACIFDFMIKGYPGLLQLAMLNEKANSSVLEDFDVISQTPMIKVHRSIYRTRMLIPFGLQYSNFEQDEPGDLCLEVMYASLMHGEFIKFANLAETMFITFDVDRSYGKSSLETLGLLVKSTRELAKIWSFYYEYREVKTLADDLARLHKRIGRVVDEEEKLRDCPGLLKLMLMFVYFLAGRQNPSTFNSELVQMKNVPLPFKVLWLVNFASDSSLLASITNLMEQAKGMDKLIFVGLGRHTDCLTQLSNHLYATGDYQLVSHLLVSARVFEAKKLYFNKFEKAVALDFHTEDESPLELRNYSDEHFDINAYMRAVMESTQENSKLISQVLSQGRFSPPYHMDEFFPQRYLHSCYRRENYIAMARACVIRYFCILDSLGKGSYKQCLLQLLGDETFHRPQTIECKMELQCNYCSQPRTVTIHKPPKKEDDKLKGLRPPPMKPGRTAGKWIAEEKRRQEQEMAIAENRAVSEVILEIGNDGNGETTEAEKKSPPAHACHGCGKSYPRCAVCSIADRAIIRIDHSAGPIACHFVACTKCSHGGHVYHMLQWFEDGNRICPIPECECECDILPRAERISAA